MKIKVYVAVQDFREGDEVDCLGVWKDKNKTVESLKKTLRFVPDFSDPTSDEPYFGTEDWTVTVMEQDLVE